MIRYNIASVCFFLVKIVSIFLSNVIIFFFRQAFTPMSANE